MTLKSPQPLAIKNKEKWVDILCKKCGATILFDKDHVSSSGKPKTNGEPHIKYCMYATCRSNLGVRSILSEFLLITTKPKSKREIWAVGKARDE